MKEALVKDLRRLGIKPGMEVLVHSSLSSLGYVDGGAPTVIAALLEAVDEAGGTLLAPTLTGTREDGPARPPAFDLRHSPCWTGIIPETLRQRSDAVRSLHPTHSVAAIGAGAVNLTTGHEDCWTPCGYGSPYYRLARRGGCILLLGVTLESNTTFHTVEELAGAEYHLQPAPVACTMLDRSGRAVVRRMLLHDWGTGRCFSRMEERLLAKGIMREGPVGRARSFLIDAGAFVDEVLAAMRQDRRILVAER